VQQWVKNQTKTYSQVMTKFGKQVQKLATSFHASFGETTHRVIEEKADEQKEFSKI